MKAIQFKLMIVVLSSLLLFQTNLCMENQTSKQATEEFDPEALGFFMIAEDNDTIASVVYDQPSLIQVLKDHEIFSGNKTSSTTSLENAIKQQEEHMEEISTFIAQTQQEIGQPSIGHESVENLEITEKWYNKPSVQIASIVGAGALFSVTLLFLKK
jgi:dsDNA-binding SOS-regulon protein